MPSKAIGKIGQGLQFDGTDDYLGTTNINPNSSAISLSFWMNISQAQSSKIALEVSPNFNNVTDGLAITVSDSVGGGCNGQLTAGISTNGITYSSFCITQPAAGAWHHYVIVADKSKTSSEVQIYLNGVLPTQIVNNDGNQAGTFGSQPLFFAARYNGGSPGNQAAIKLDDTRYYNRALSTDEIKRLYNMGK